MWNETLRFGSGTVPDTVIKVLLSLVVMGALGPVVIEFQGNLPMTLQTLAILLPCILFGWRVALLATLGYLSGGMLGAPVFAGYSGGADHFAGPGGGFLLSFPIAGLVCGALAEIRGARSPVYCFLIWVLGHLIILVLGGFWLRRFDPEGWWEIVRFLLPGAAMKTAFGLLLTQLFLRITMSRERFYS